MYSALNSIQNADFIP